MSEPVQPMESGALAAGLKRWGPKALLTLADQGLFSGASFLLNVLLARWLSPEAYGAFALSFSIFLFLGSLHTSLLTEPMLVLGAARLRQTLRAYLGFLLAGHLAVSLAGSLLLAAAAAILAAAGQDLLAAALGGTAIAASLILLPWLLRRALYIEAQPGWAAGASALYLLAVLGGLAGLRSVDQLTVFSAYLALAAASLLVSLGLLLKLGPRLPNRGELREMAAAQWDYGRWSSLSAVLVWVPMNLFTVAIPYSAGLAGAAALRAIANLLAPLVQGTQALVVLLLPQLAQVFQLAGKAALSRRLRGLLLAFAAGASLYWALLSLWRAPLLDWLYAGQYNQLAGLLPLAALLPVLMGAASLVGSGLRAMERPKAVFQGYLAAALIAATLGLALTTYGQVAGAIGGQLLAYLGLLAALAYLLRRA